MFTEDFRKSTEDFPRLLKIAKDYPKNSEDFRKLAKVAEEKPKILEYFQMTRFANIFEIPQNILFSRAPRVIQFL